MPRLQHGFSSTRSIPSCMSSIDDELAGTLRAQLSGRNVRFGEPDELLDAMGAVWVLLFQPGELNEGVYTLQGRVDSRTYILAFELLEDAGRFAELLSAEGFDCPVPCEWTNRQVAEFCSSAGYTLSMVDEGTVLMPPMHNVYDTEAFEAMHRGDDVTTLGHESDGLRKERDELERLFGLP
eukprot:CAMPEP_0119298034 /NCGR_PEP_ID=MMETSP1333-20130426/241_1 /TAXON_ID=418940 /ORGANISM="Scyphosphaera apsteinii, Strain RCC1455" /LENGTH=180 /DNA_ID=CAMNT_0007299025 /DNA_START=143 /DNA_END=685 /DNA_ORIENTATION=+